MACDFKTNVHAYLRTPDGVLMVNVDEIRQVLQEIRTCLTRLAVERTGAPTSAEDGGQGYSVGSVWTDDATGFSYTLVDDTLGAPVWRRTIVIPLAPEGGAASGSAGDILVTDATGAFNALSIGADGTLLIADSGQAAGVRWAAGSGSGIDADLLDGLDSTAFLRVDGSLPLTANWAVGGFDLTGLSSLLGSAGAQLDLTVPDGAGTGGTVKVNAGSSSAASGGNVVLYAGGGAAGFAGGRFEMYAGDGGDGGGMLFQAGLGGGAGDDGGDIDLIPGIAGGVGGTDGKVRINDGNTNLAAVLDASAIATADKTFSFPNQSGIFSLEGHVHGEIPICMRSESVEQVA